MRMKWLRACGLLALLPGLAVAQQYPSPTYQDLHLRGTLFGSSFSGSINNAPITGGSITGTSIINSQLTNPTISGGTITGTTFVNPTFVNPITSGTITGATITGSPISGSTGAFSTLSASGTVSGAGITALLAPYALASADALKLPLAGGTLTGAVTSTAAGTAMTINNNFKVTGTGTIGTLVTTAGATIGASLTATNNIFAQGGILTLGTAAGGGGSITNAATGGGPFTFNLAGSGQFVWKDSANTTLMTLATSGIQIPTPIRSSSTYLATGVGSVYTMSGSGSAALIGIGANYTGSYTGTDGIMSITNATDDVAMSGGGSTGASLVINRQFGGPNMRDGRTGAYINLVLTAPMTVQPPRGFIAIEPHIAILANAGGTGLTGGTPGGLAYAMYPQVVLHHGATNFTIASLGEGDLGIQPSSQTFDITGTITAGDTFSLVVTSADVPGSPVTLTVTAGTGDTAASIVNKLMAAFRTPDLNAAGIAGMQTSIQQLNVMWQVQKAPVTVALSTSGAAVITPGSIVSGASAQQRRGFTINRSSDDGSRGDSTDVAFEIGALATASPASGFSAGISFRAEGMSPTSTLIRAVNQLGFSASSVSGPFTPLAAKYGIDFSLINFTQAGGVAIKVPGATLGAGTLGLQNGFISTTAAGITIDVPGGLIGSGNPAIVSGGIGTAGQDHFRYFLGDLEQDANGGQYLVDGVDNSTGNVTHLTTLVQPSTSTGSLGVGIATTGGSSLGLTITPTAAAANNNLSLMPSGGATTMGGSLTVTGTITGYSTTSQIASTYAPLASPTFTGAPTSPTAAPGTNTTQIATTAFSAAAIAVETSRATTAEALLAPKASPTFTGTIQINGGVNVGSNTTQQALSINGPAGVGRVLIFDTAGVKRFQWNLNATPEGGANAGSDLMLQAEDDSGAALSTPITVTRATGNITFSGIITASSLKVGANQVVGARATGWTAMTGTPDLATAFATSTVTLAQLAGRVMSLQAAMTTHGLIGP